MVNSVQLVLLLIYEDFDLPANTQLTTQAIFQSSQFEFFKALSFDTLSFNNDTEAFNNQFDEQGFHSAFVIDNLQALYKNINILALVALSLIAT